MLRDRWMNLITFFYSLFPCYCWIDWLPAADVYRRRRFFCPSGMFEILLQMHPDIYEGLSWGAQYSRRMISRPWRSSAALPECISSPSIFLRTFCSAPFVLHTCRYNNNSLVLCVQHKVALLYSLTANRLIDETKDIVDLNVKEIV